MSNSLIDELKARGLLAQVSDEEGLSEHLESGSRTVYCGFDPTADSLHIGNLVPLLTLRRFQQHGHRPILLLGGATGLIGDPSGRSDERSLNQADVVAGWVEKIRRQVSGLVSFEGNNAAIIENNLEWTALIEAVILGDGGPDHQAVVRLLVDAGADREIADRDGVTPLVHARSRNYDEIVAILEGK